MKEKLCPECNRTPLKFYRGSYSTYCIECTGVVRRRKEREERNKNKEDMKDRKCEKCEKYFTPHLSTQKYCQNPCKYKKTTKDLNLNWINK